MSFAAFFQRILGKKPAIPRDVVMKKFRRRYVSFKELLQSNADLGKILASLDEAMRDGGEIISIGWIRTQATQAVFHAMRMASCLNEISGGRYTALDTQLEAINARITAELETRPSTGCRDLTLPLSRVCLHDAECVGNKSANLGELATVMQLPVPRGFAVTTAAYHAFMRSHELLESVRKILRGADPAQPESVLRTSRAVKEYMCSTPLPSEVETALLHAWDTCFGENAATVQAALRSSAPAEDGSHSFAGQYLTVLGVRRDTLCTAFRQVAASLFSPRAITYRLLHGYVFESLAMAMCCLEMVDAQVAGVAFSRHPVDLHVDDVLINALWGLGELVVDGAATPDSWQVSRDTLEVITHSVAHKPVMLHLHPEKPEKALSVAVPEGKQDIPCLTAQQVQELTRMVLALENHYHQPQDVEWALDQTGRFVFLQTRPIRLADGRHAQIRPGRHDAPLLLEGGDIAVAGVGCGPVVPVNPDDGLENFPQGGVLLAKHSSPNIMVALKRAQAILAETGSMTGHMASVCREFGIPTLLNLPGAWEILQAGQIVTVDALSGRIYAGEVPELLELRDTAGVQLRNTPVHALLDRVASHILPLHLIDPRAATFTPQHCMSLHDIMRFVHEQSYSEMFRLSDSASDAGAVASHLRCRVPLDLYIIDLGDGLKNPEASVVTPEDILSVPFQLLLRGMLCPEVQAKGPRPINVSGFLSVMGQSMIGGNQRAGERFGDRSYAIISDRYLNFSSRVGYHYAVLDAWCGDTMNKNYITFKFSGGAADSLRRERRVRCIGRILQTLGFRVEITADRLEARFQKYPREKIEANLDQLGRLLIMTRQMDMLMNSEAAVQEYADRFLTGQYH